MEKNPWKFPTVIAHDFCQGNRTPLLPPVLTDFRHGFPVNSWLLHLDNLPRMQGSLDCIENLKVEIKSTINNDSWSRLQ